MAWKFDAGVSVAIQIQHKLALDILGGIYAPGTPFPTVRALAFEASVNPNTMQKALTALEEQGLLVGHGTAGRFVTEDTAVLQEIRKKMQREYLLHVIREATALGITTEDFLRFIKESEGSH